jgi:DHA1 family multidrug resistance protein-like MFS transporter
MAFQYNQEEQEQGRTSRLSATPTVHSTEHFDDHETVVGSTFDKDTQHDAEKYDGGDGHRALSRTADESSVSEIVPEMVQWDSSDDPTNPQNWSFRYKVFLTVVCSIVTINV